MSLIALPYGKIELLFELPAKVRIIELPEIKKEVAPEKFILELTPFLNAIPLKGSVAVVVADKTRSCEYDRYLSILIDAILQQGVDKEQISLYIAYGTHLPQSDGESQATYGNTWSQCRFIHHDCEDHSLFIELGTTKQGTPIRLRKDIYEADYLITFGAISHHYFAGYGGGRKLIFPGLGEKRAIYHNHGLFLDRKKDRLSSGCMPGRLRGNPVAEDLSEIERRRPADLAIHGILNHDGRLCRLLVGTGADHFRSACKIHAADSEIRDSSCYDLVLASCGGFPKDINLIQSHKAIHYAAMFVKDGGTLVLLAQCKDRVGSKTFLPWFELKSRRLAFERLAENYQGNGGTALALMEKTRRIKICLLTDLNQALCHKLNVHKLPYPTAVKKVRQHSGSLAVIPNAGYLVKV
jgi:nickel-dependent lactate racemase